MPLKFTLETPTRPAAALLSERDGFQLISLGYCGLSVSEKRRLKPMPNKTPFPIKHSVRRFYNDLSEIV
jgi:hypothetical protein